MAGAVAGVVGDDPEQHDVEASSDDDEATEALLREELQAASQLAAMSDGPAPMCYSSLDLRSGLSFASSLSLLTDSQRYSSMRRSQANQALDVPLLAPEVEEEQDAALQDVLDAEASHLPGLQLRLMLMLSGWVVVVGLAKGTLPCGSWQWWLLVSSIMLPAAATLWVMRRRVLRHAAIKQKCGVEVQEGERAMWLGLMDISKHSHLLHH